MTKICLIWTGEEGLLNPLKKYDDLSLRSQGRRLSIYSVHSGREGFEEVRVCLEFFADLQDKTGAVSFPTIPRQNGDPRKGGGRE